MGRGCASEVWSKFIYGCQALEKMEFKTAVLVHLSVKIVKETQVTGLAFTMTKSLMWPKHMGFMVFFSCFSFTHLQSKYHRIGHWDTTIPMQTQTHTLTKVCGCWCDLDQGPPRAGWLAQPETVFLVRNICPVSGCITSPEVLFNTKHCKRKNKHRKFQLWLWKEIMLRAPLKHVSSFF